MGVGLDCGLVELVSSNAHDPPLTAPGHETGTGLHPAMRRRNRLSIFRTAFEELSAHCCLTESPSSATGAARNRNTGTAEQQPKIQPDSCHRGKQMEVCPREGLLYA